MSHFNRAFSKLLYKGHRHIGFSVSLVLILLSLTGIALNHTNELQLDQRFIKSPFILDWYGITRSKNPKSYAIQSHWLSQLEDTLYLDHKAILETKEPLIGAVSMTNFTVAAFPNTLLLLTPKGELIESISKANIEKIALQKQLIFIRSQQQVYSSNDQLLSWQKTEQQPVAWSEKSPLPRMMAEELKQKSRERILDYERLILDIHSGRFFGTWGVYLMDVSAILLIFLAITGMWFWLRHSIKRINKRNR